jgi:hypothetical protein
MEFGQVRMQVVKANPSPDDDIILWKKEDAHKLSALVAYCRVSLKGREVVGQVWRLY